MRADRCGTWDVFGRSVVRAPAGAGHETPSDWGSAVIALSVLGGVAPERCVYLDDLGINLKPARALGMRTIKVGDPDVAIDELQAMVGIPLRG